MNFSNFILSVRYFRSNFVNLTNQSVNLATKEKWDLLSAVCVERKPVITRDHNEFEKNISKLFQELEYEGSHKSNFEIRLQIDEKIKKELKEGKVTISDMDSAPQQTGEDFLDLCREELKTFKLAPRVGDISVENDPKSLKRAFDRYLLLIVKDKIGNNDQWILPQGNHQEGETLRQSAERILKEKCGDKLNVKFLGNAPYGFYKYKYPKPVRTNDSIGAKIFFFKAIMIKGQVECGQNKCSDFKWATRNEMDTLPNEYRKSIRMFLIDEEH